MLRWLYNGLWLVGLTVFWSIAGAFVLPFNMKRGIAFIARRWGLAVTQRCGIELSSDGLHHIVEGPAYVVMANHTSHMDVPSLFATLPIDMRPVAKRELGWIPIFGWLLGAGAAIMIDRGDKARAVRSIERAGATIRAGASVLMFPEGTRTPPGELGPLKKGPFHLALSAQVPVLPVGVIGTGAVLLPGDWRIRPGPVQIHVGAPIPTSGRADNDVDRAALMAEVEAALAALMGKKGPESKP